MKKFTLIVLTALMAVATYGQRAVMPISGEKIAHAPKALRINPNHASPDQSFSSITKSLKAKAPRREAAIPTGLVMINQSATDDPKTGGNSVDIEMIDETHVAISHFTNEATEKITATFDVANMTVTIPAGQTLFTHPTYGAIKLAAQNPNNMETMEPDFTADIVGTINLEGGYITITTMWGDFLSEGQYAGYVWTNLWAQSMIFPANGKMEVENLQTNSTMSYNVLIEQSEDNSTTTVYNFGNYGLPVDIEMNSDKSIKIYQQMVADLNNEIDGGDAVTYTFSGTALTGTTITGTFDDNAISFSGWTGAWPSGNQYSVIGLFGDTKISYISGQTFATPAEVEDVAATPATPTDLALFQTEDGPVIQFNVPLKDVDGNMLRKDKLFYQIWYKVSIMENVYTLTTANYTKIDADMEMVPYDYTENWDIYSEGELKTVYLYGIDSWDAVGVTAIYTGGGVTKESDTLWLDITSDGIKDIDAAAQKNGALFNLSGQQVGNGYRGIVIKNGRKYLVK